MLSFSVSYCVSNILQRIKLVNKMWWYKLLFSNYAFEQNIYFSIEKVKPKMFIVIIWLSLYSLFFFLFIFQCFLSAFFFFFNVFCVPLPNQENHDSKWIPLKYDVNTRLLDSSVSWEKNIGFSLCIEALYVKAFCTIS